jgi:peptidoglycan hydrolase-like protein with peptidoglycan-binding domain
VGKIDGVFANKGSTTSKTKEAVKKFQKDNGLTPDGIPGQKTIAKLVEGLLVFPPLWAFPFKKNPGQQPREVFKK